MSSIRWPSLKRLNPLPGLGAVGGMAVPAAVYCWLNWGDPVAIDGWAVPVATDIAFALGLLSVFGRRVPIGLKVFLLTLAIFDDLAAIVIIALFYSGDLTPTALAVEGSPLAPSPQRAISISCVPSLPMSPVPKLCHQCQS